MYEVEAVCDRVLFLSRGKILLEGDPRTLPGLHGAATLEELFIRVAREPLVRRMAPRCELKLRPIAGIVLRQIYLLRGSPVRLFPMITWVAIDIVLWGFITRYLNSVSGSGMNFVPTLLGAVLMWDFCDAHHAGVSTAFLEDVWSRNFLNLFASPLLISEYVTGLVITSILTGCLGLVVMLVLATTVSACISSRWDCPWSSFCWCSSCSASRSESRQRDRAAVRPRIGMAVVAAAGRALALCRRVLSARDVPRMDAGGCARSASILCVRRHARLLAGRPSPGSARAGRRDGR